MHKLDMSTISRHLLLHLELILLESLQLLALGWITYVLRLTSTVHFAKLNARIMRKFHYDYRQEWNSITSKVTHYFLYCSVVSRTSSLTCNTYLYQCGARVTPVPRLLAGLFQTWRCKTVAPFRACRNGPCVHVSPEVRTQFPSML